MVVKPLNSNTFRISSAFFSSDLISLSLITTDIVIKPKLTSPQPNDSSADKASLTFATASGS